MRKLILLVQAQLQNVFSSRMKMSGKQKLGKASGIAVLLLMFLAISCCYQFYYITFFQEQGQLVSYIPCIVSLSILLTLMTTLFSAKSILFNSKDYDFLQSVPISSRTIVCSRIITLYVYELMFTLLIMVPGEVILAILTNDYSTVVPGILLSLFLPLIPVLVASLLSYVLAFVFEKFKYKNVIQIIFYVLFIAAIVVGSLLSSTDGGIFTMGNLLDTYYPPMHWYLLGVSGDWLSILYLILVSLASLVVFSLIIGLGYKKLCNLVMHSDYHTNYVEKELKKSSQTRALLGKEWLRLSKSPTYFINTMFGNMLLFASSLVFLVVMLVNRNDSEIMETVNQFAFAIPGMCVLLSGMCTPGCVIFSLEGKNFWILQSSPVDGRRIIKAKYIFTLLTCLPIACLCALFFGIAIQASALSIILAVLVTGVIMATTCTISLLVNLRFPKLDWENETMLVKQSMATVVAMFINMGISLAAAAIGFAFVVLLNQELALLILLGINLVFFGLIFILYRKKSLSLFQKI